MSSFQIIRTYSGYQIYGTIIKRNIVKILPVSENDQNDYNLRVGQLQPSLLENVHSRNSSAISCWSLLFYDSF